MNYIGKWEFHSIGVMDDSFTMVYMGKEEYLRSPMPYVDEEDAEAVAEEMQERQMMVSTQLQINEDGTLVFLVPLPEDAPMEEVEQAVAAGEIQLVDGMLCRSSCRWEERDGELWYDTGMEGEVFGEEVDGWAKALDENGLFTFATTRFVKAE